MAILYCGSPDCMYVYQPFIAMASSFLASVLRVISSMRRDGLIGRSLT
jgi:hypothetical protein